ncbi:DUF397 domain-containing protein [Microbispora hainanensis]|jgi:hypothetical protein|uniref:DUF397 domain-containing protein n=1 Tax=Microbispora hainanensis TaxID=568844 RepID=A0ABZ1T2B3_9ACTN|nr:MULTISPECIES: DUF397 domain-containing protein [Microbispora]NJP24865.1 DUF397 domain-containing protein [Microbispora sp. CL1-1]TQS14326.1 DUF397 domain-containing protein [Microbispora sp. SCL1-1]
MDLSRARWRKSSYSGSNGGDCVEVAEIDGDGPEHKSGRLIAVRDSKDPDGPVLFFTPEEWKAFLLGVHAGEFEPTP